jgi:hypothetical protein
VGWIFPEVFQCKVSAQAKADKVYGLVSAPAGMQYNGMEVVRCTAVVKPELPVHFSAAPTVIPGQHVIPLCAACPDHAFYIGAVAVSFQSVRNDYQYRGALKEPVEIEKVVIGCGYAFTLVWRQLYLSKQGRKDGFQMGVKQEGRWCVTQWEEGSRLYNLCI